MPSCPGFPWIPLASLAMHGSPETSLTPRNNFDALRLIGALLVVFSHQFALSGRWEPRFVGNHSFGNFGVLIFFSISGYLVTASWMNDPHLGRFAARRVARLLPALAVSIPLTFAVVSALGLLGFPDNAHHLLNGSLWTIPYEVTCYILLALLGWIFQRPALWLALAISMLFVATGGEYGKNFVADFGLFFSMGALLRAYPRLSKPPAIVLFCAAACALISLGQTKLGLAFVVPPLAIAVGRRSWSVTRSAGQFGDLSYGIYIYAWPVQQVTVALMGANSSYFALLGVSLPIIVAFACLSWHFIEKVALRYKPASPRGEVYGGIEATY